MTPPEKRRDERLEVAWHGALCTEDGEKKECNVLDISQAGALIKCDIRPDIGQDLILTIEGLGDFAGRVKWCGQQSVGLLLIAGPDLSLKKFAIKAGSSISEKPSEPDIYTN